MRPGAIKATALAAKSVMFEKLQDISGSKLLGRGAGADGTAQEITLGTNLSMSGATLNASGEGGTSDHGALTGLADDDHVQYALADGSRGTFEVAGAVAAHAAAADPHTGYQKESEKGAVNGYASLDAGGTIPDAQIPATIARDSELHAAVTLAADADVLLGLSTQQLTLDSQSANLVFAGPASGGAVDPTFRSLVDADIPAAIARDSEVTTAVANHEAAADPHTGYQRESEKAATNGYASLDANTRVPLAQLGSGSPDATKFLRGDASWEVPPGGGGGLTHAQVLARGLGA